MRTPVVFALAALACVASLTSGCSRNALPITNDGSTDGASPDLVTPLDMSVPPQVDFAVADANAAPAVDIAIQPDLVTPPDLTTFPDLTPEDLTGDDLTMPPFPPFTPPLAPRSTHVGFTGLTCCIQTHPSGKVLYLANVDFASGTGDLHLFDGATDTVLQGKSEPVDAYAFSGDGKWALYLASAVDQNQNALRFVEVANLQNNFPAIVDGVPSEPLLDSAFFTPSKKYLVAGVQPAGVNYSLDLHVVDMATGKDILQLPNGAFDYLETVTNDDIMLFQNLVGNANPNDPGVLTLYSLPLTGILAGAQPVPIDIHTGSLQLSQDTKTLYYNKTNGQLWSYDVAGKTTTMIAASGPQYAVGPLASGPVAYIAADGSVHVAVNNKDVWASPPKSGDLFSPLYFSPDASYVYFFQNVDTQDDKGDLWFAPASANAAPQLIAKGAALQVTTTADRLLYFANSAQQGLVGDLTSAHLDGTDPVLLAPAALANQLMIPTVAFPAAPLPVVYSALGSGKKDPIATNQPVDGTPPTSGALALGRGPDGPLAPLSPSVHADDFEYSDDGRVLLYSANGAFDGTVTNWVGTLSLYDIGGARTLPPIQPGVSELGPITHRQLFVNAPKATPAGVYYVTF